MPARTNKKVVKKASDRPEELVYCIRFKLYAEEDAWYAVNVFATRKDMYAYFHTRGAALGITKRRDDYEAMTIGYYRKEKDGCAGELLFYLKSITQGIVAHEMAHATIYRFKKRTDNKLWKSPKMEEKFCSMHGEMVATFWRTWNKKSTAANVGKLIGPKPIKRVKVYDASL